LVGSLLGLVGWIVAMVQAKRRKLFHLPVIGLIADGLTRVQKKQRVFRICVPVGYVGDSSLCRVFALSVNRRSGA
jgi:hypothetical protein